MAQLHPYSQYIPIDYDYVKQLPAGWRLLPNIALFEERIERGNGEHELLSISISKGVVKQSDMDKKDISSPDKSNYKIVKAGDIAYGMEFRKGAVGFSVYKGIVSPVYTILKPRKQNMLNPKFFHYVFRTEYYKNYIWRNVYGIGEHFLPCRFTHFKRMYSIVPPLDTQNRIVEYLDKKNDEIDRFIRNKERLIELLEEEKSSIILKLVTKGINCSEFKNSNVNWIGEVPKHWVIKRLRFLCKITTGNKNTEDKRDEGEYPFFVRSQIIERINSYSFDGESILTAGDGAGVGKVFHYVNGKFDYHQRVYNFYNFKTVIGLYLFYYIKTNFHNVALMGDAKSTVDSLRLPLIKDFEITYPTEIDEQKSIVNKIESECSIIDLAISKAQQPTFRTPTCS
jgi:type I restriction enzyme S subunit